MSHVMLSGLLSRYTDSVQLRLFVALVCVSVRSVGEMWWPWDSRVSFPFLVFLSSRLFGCDVCWCCLLWVVSKSVMTLIQL
ncbi:hypothetical protein BDW42DRAFT_174966 [Aspergillus taichungensis]|uniref:Uncharacterized protein n=1 Tax=Aspergillus taichungensis TaxID=482145 RepID=A0A2J5HMX1_9EURO|nr:hypothetical protein BDW42DRAFT_174966 [Aspergillus taichungensis]